MMILWALVFSTYWAFIIPFIFQIGGRQAIYYAIDCLLMPEGVLWYSALIQWCWWWYYYVIWWWEEIVEVILKFRRPCVYCDIILYSIPLFLVFAYYSYYHCRWLLTLTLFCYFMAIYCLFCDMYFPAIVLPTYKSICILFLMVRWNYSLLWVILIFRYDGLCWHWNNTILYYFHYYGRKWNILVYWYFPLRWYFLFHSPTTTRLVCVCLTPTLLLLPHWKEGNLMQTWTYLFPLLIFLLLTVTNDILVIVVMMTWPGREAGNYRHYSMCWRVCWKWWPWLTVWVKVLLAVLCGDCVCVRGND